MIRTSLLIMLVVLGSASEVTGQVKAKRSAAQRTAEFMERTGKVEEAIDIYQELLEKNSRNLQVYWRLKELYRRIENFDDGIALVKKHLDDFPDDIQAHIDLGEFYYLKKNTDQAFKVWKDLETSFGKSPVVYRQLLTLYARLGLEQQLMDMAQRGRIALKNPTFMAFDLGNYYQMRQAVPPAIREYLLHGSSRPGTEEQISTRIMQLSQDANGMAVAERVLKEYRSIYPILVQVVLADMYFSLEKYNQAFELHQNLGLQSNRDMKRFLDFAQNLREENEFNHALAAYQFILNSDSPVKDRKIVGTALLGLGQSYEDQILLYQQPEPLIPFFDGNKIFSYVEPLKDDTLSATLETAFTFYDSILADMPATTFSSKANFRLGEIQYRVIHQFEAAQRSYQAALKNKPDPTIKDLARIRLGQLFLAHGDIDSAIAYFSFEMNQRPVAQLNYIQSIFLKGDMQVTLQTLDSILPSLPPESNNFNDIMELSDFLETYYVSGSPEDRLLFSSFITGERLLAQMKIAEAADFLAFARFQIPDSRLNPWLMYREAELRQTLGQGDRVLELADELKGSYLEESGWILSGNAYEILFQDIRKAKNDYTRFLEMFPESIYFEPVRRHLRAMQN